MMLSRSIIAQIIQIEILNSSHSNSAVKGSQNTKVRNPPVTNPSNCWRKSKVASHVSHDATLARPTPDFQQPTKRFRTRQPPTPTTPRALTTTTMAPTQGKRKSLRAKASSGSKPTPSTSAPTPSGPVLDTPFTNFHATKKDKRDMKHSLLLSKVQKSAPGSGSKKRRRPNKQLVTTLSSLADALPDAADAGFGDGDEDGAVEVGQAVIRQRSLKSRPGALKRKEKLERVERERFGRNLALMSAGQPQGEQMQAQAQAPVAATTGDRWKALRGFIEGTMERKKEFVTG
ncbi:uncharacterized protein K452DRAFT_360080 [Aplosporella prunicola CBS 121167]|uniref:Ribosome biogenesis protein SLX9 n=1 Tax=Aplosporella prunicola CBS 121167 TaxID=1176127 RepID=A0A6A6B7G1_9PEZI|nr:uncharacterized protein K452DRAFT_360080 [Aplosporella prunicola CBS 121167]KAF2139836.1 hypothetical protein K452DRAFT_360080 [Aplosporella prunicola CBS 121167]